MLGVAGLMSERRPPIPASLARQVRQEAGFCCVICGEMPCEIEHITPWSVCREHDLENLTLLCDKHHKEVTSGRLSKDAVRRAKVSPAGKKRGSTFYQFHHRPLRYTAFGSNIVSLAEGANVRLLAMRERTVIGFRVFRGAPLYECCLTDPTGKVSLRIVDNTVLGRHDLWDIKLSGTRFQVYYGQRRRVLDLRIADSQLFIRDLKAFTSGVAVLVSPDGIYANVGIGGQSYDSYMIDCAINIAPGSIYNIIAGEEVQGSALWRLPVVKGDLSSKEAYKWLFSHGAKARS